MSFIHIRKGWEIMVVVYYNNFYEIPAGPRQRKCSLEPASAGLRCSITERGTIFAYLWLKAQVLRVRFGEIAEHRACSKVMSRAKWIDKNED